MKLIKYLALYFFVVFGSSLTYANITLVAEPGMPAPGFDPGFIYWAISPGGNPPVINRNGQIAFGGFADVSAGSTPNNTYAIWTGFPGQLRTVIKAGDVPAGFPPNVTFKGTVIVGKDAYVVTSSGMVVINGIFNGPVPWGLVADINGTVEGIVKAGDQAPGFSPGTTFSTIQLTAASDAGVVFAAFTNTVEFGIWFWDSQAKTIQLVAGPSGDASAAYPGCSYSTPIPFSLVLPTINDDGDIAFLASLTGTGCPFNPIVRWNRGVLSAVASKDDPVPGFPANVVTNLFVTALGGLQINDAGSVTYQSTLLDQNTFQQRTSVWVAHKNGAKELVGIVNEFMPDNPSGLILSILPYAHINASGKTVIGTISTNFVQSILAGPPKTSFSYPDLVSLGTSHLNVLLNNSDIPPGFDNTWYYDTLDGPLINNQGMIALTGIAKDSLNPFTSATVGLWKGAGTNSLQLIAKQGGTINIDGVADTLTGITSISPAQFGGSTNGGRALQMSDCGQIIFTGTRTAGTGPSIFITNKPRKLDHNGDGKTDVMLRHSDGRWYYYPMNGKAVLTGQQGGAFLTPNTSWQYQGSGDYNGDGKADILVRHTDGRWYYFPMDGKNILTAQQGGAFLTSNTSWQYQGSGDMNGDGKDDVLVRHTDGRWYYFPMNGKNILTGQQGGAFLTPNTSWQFAGMGDMNGDGKDDVLVRHTDGRWYYYPMNGKNILTGQQGGAFLTSNTSWQLAGMGDMNGDGKDDVLVRHTDGRWYYFPMNGKNILTGQQGGAFLTSNTSWQFAGIGDMNGDCKDDVLVRHTDGRWYYFPMNGKAVIAAQQGGAFLTPNTAWGLP